MEGPRPSTPVEATRTAPRYSSIQAEHKEGLDSEGRLRDHPGLLVRVRRDHQGRDRRALQGSRSPDRPRDGCVHDAVVIRASVLAGTTRSR